MCGAVNVVTTKAQKLYHCLWRPLYAFRSRERQQTGPTQIPHTLHLRNLCQIEMTSFVILVKYISLSSDRVGRELSGNTRT
jgi:hypothetical protein